MATPDELRRRLRALQDERELAAMRHEALRTRERIAEQTRLAIGQEQAAANRARREEASRLEQLENEIAEMRRRLAEGRPGPNEVTDRAVVAWLERVEGVDVGAIRETILRAAADATPDGSDRGLDYFRYRGSRLVVREGKVVTILA